MQAVSGDSGLDEAAELLLIAFLVLGFKFAHIIGNMATKDVLAQHLSIQGVLFLVKSGEALLTVREIDTSVDGTLHGGKDLGSGRGASQTNIKIGLKGTGTIFFIEFGLVDAKVGQHTTSAEETSAVGGGKVGQTDLDTIVGQLVRVSRSKDEISLNLGIDDLADDVGVGEADNEAILAGVVLVLVLDDQTLAGIIIGLSLTTTTILYLEALKVGFIFDTLDKRL